jgi:hypothetical protein
VVLVLDGEGLLELNYDLSTFSDPYRGEGECDWENEIACWDDIEPLDEVLMAVEPVPVPPERYRVLIKYGIEECNRRFRKDGEVARPRRAAGTIFQ